jgi:hypothetical protein
VIGGMKSILHKNFQTNKNLEKTGITLEYHDTDEPDVPPVKIRIARAGGANTAYDKAIDQKTRSIRRAIAANAVSMSELNRITREAFAETVVLGWENVTDPDGKVLPFSRDNCIQLFTDLPDLFEDVRAQAQQAQLFRVVMQEADAKN